ncbi:MAG: CHAD domain-containing protein [Parvularculaceae bacterium]
MARAKTEIELKLVGAPGDIDAVRASQMLDQIATGPATWERLVSAYYDTPAHALTAMGISLRLRNDPDGAMLSVKQKDAAGGVIARLEAERLMRGERDFETGDDLLDAAIAPHRADLTVIAQTATDRWWRIVKFAGATIEISGETGSAKRFDGSAGAVVAPIAEVELELLKGDAAGVFALARALATEFSGRLRLSLASKLDRAMSGGLAAPLGKAPKPSVSDGALAADALSRSLFAAAARLVAVGPHFTDLRDPEAARGLRVALRRFRSLERAFRFATKKTGLRDLSATARNFARIAGEVRDLDVFLAETLPMIEPAFTGEPAPAQRLKARVEELRARQWSKAATVFSGSAFTVFQLDLIEMAFFGPWRAHDERLGWPLNSFATRVLDRRHSKVMATAASIDFSRPADLHELRLQMKKLRYAAQTFRDAYPKEVRQNYFKAMSVLQASFGELNDAVTAQSVADKAAQGLGPDMLRVAGFVAGFTGARAAFQAGAIERQWAAFAVIEPYWRTKERVGAQNTDNPLP